MSRGADGTLAVPVSNDRVRATYDRLDLSDATVLEVGCGPGRTLATVAERVGPDGRAVGIDAAPAMVRAARERLAERGPEASTAVALGDARRLPLATGAADVVCAMDVLDLFERADLAAVLGECRRVLGSDGRLCVVTMDRAAVPDSWFLRAYELAYERVPGFARVGCRPIPAVEAVRAAGFDVLSTAERERAGVWPVTVLTATPVA